MSTYYRREENRELLFLKDINLKHIANKVVSVLPKEYSKDEFLAMFKQCYTRQWEKIVFYCRTKKKDYIRRKKMGLRTVPYYSPKEFICKHFGGWKHTQTWPSEEDRLKQIERLTNKSKKKEKEFLDKLNENFVSIQKVCPSYVQKLIRLYFKSRRANALDVNARYLMLLEAGQFYSHETVSFLHQIAACEKNDDLRMLAYDELVKMGQQPWLARKRKGKKKQSQTQKIDIRHNPTALLELLSSNQHLIFQRYDIFLSHSSYDKEELLRLKSILNRQGLAVYIDWVNDKVMLYRENQDENTWNVLYQRMDQSDRMLYVMTVHSIATNSTRKELEYFKRKGKPVYVYTAEPTSLDKPDYLNGCLECNIQDEKFVFPQTALAKKDNISFK